MKNILVIESSHNREQTGSRHISAQIQARIREKYPQANIIVHDLTTEALPHPSEKMLTAFHVPPDQQNEELKEAIRLSNQLTDEVLKSDLVIISAPLWNFSIPSSVKAWIDHVVRAGKTFSYSPNGPVGLLKNTKAIIVASTGGIYSEGPMKAFDFLVPYLQSVMKFIGIVDVQAVRLEGTKVPQFQDLAMKKAEQAVENLKL